MGGQVVTRAFSGGRINNGWQERLQTHEEEG
jgi:hypothetical protein